MIDSNAIANLQMLMNSGDGRYAVLTELLQSEKVSKPEQSVAVAWTNKGLNQNSSSLSVPSKINFRGPRRNDIRLVTHSSKVDHLNVRLTENIIATLDRLSEEEKAPLIRFVEGLAYHYNNLFMAIVGHFAIVMLHLDTSHPAYNRLRTCEEVVHNTALLIRLLVDVFHRSQRSTVTAYPIDLSDREIEDRIFPKMASPYKPKDATPSVLDTNIILKIVSSVISQHLKGIFQLLECQIDQIFVAGGLQPLWEDYKFKIQSYIVKGLKGADILYDHSTYIWANNRPISLTTIIKEAVNFFELKERF